MNTNYATALALVVDRSGSMTDIASDVKGSVKQFIEEQKKASGKAFLTVAQFDHEYEIIHNFKDIHEVDGDKFAKDYSPRGNTALLDAIGRTTLLMEQKLNSLPEAAKPKRVVVAVITDGLENSSTDFNIAKIKDMIKQHEALGWDFIFMGATLDTINVAKNMGFSADKSAVYDTSNFKSSMRFVSEKISQARLGKEVKIQEAERDNLINKNQAQNASS
jgi:Mg-chelatase subunit ChlD